MRNYSIPATWIKDRVLVCLQGDKRSQEIAHLELFERLWPAALRIATTYQQHIEQLAGFGPQVAEDAAAHAYHQFLEKLESHLHRQDIVNWLHATIRNFLIREARDYNRYRLTDDISHLDRPTRTPIRAVLLDDRLYFQLRLLGHNQLHVVYFLIWEELEQAAIAKHWELTHQRISQLWLKAISLLRTRLKQDGYTDDGAADTYM